VELAGSARPELLVAIQSLGYTPSVWTAASDPRTWSGTLLARRLPLALGPPFPHHSKHNHLLIKDFSCLLSLGRRVISRTQDGPRHGRELVVDTTPEGKS
jgi:hypothetical protein